METNEEFEILHGHCEILRKQIINYINKINDVKLNIRNIIFLFVILTIYCIKDMSKKYKMPLFLSLLEFDRLFIKSIKALVSEDFEESSKNEQS